MKIFTNVETVNEIKKIIESQTEQPDNVRIYIAGMGWSGPSFGLALDELKEDDVKDTFEETNFIMEKYVFEQFGDFRVEYSGGGYLVAPTDQQESDCSSCSGSCS